MEFRRSPKRMRGDAESGFTLVELLVALMIFAMLAAAGVGLLGFSVRAQGASREKLDEVAAIRRLSALMTADLAQAAPRVSRTEAGDFVPAFTGGTGEPGEPALTFVRRGWSNSNGAARASLQKVEYVRVADRIERRAWPMLDGAEPGPPAVVARGVEGFTLRYRNADGWRERWDAEKVDALPRAVEASVEWRGIGAVKLLFLTGTGG